MLLVTRMILQVLTITVAGVMLCTMACALTPVLKDLSFSSWAPFMMRASLSSLQAAMGKGWSGQGLWVRWEVRGLLG
jgi:hypothetical protein